MNEKIFWQFARDNINESDKVLLLTVAESSNHSPGRQGFKMLLTPNGSTKGTVGGGIMEKQLTDYGLDLLSGKAEKQIKRLQHSHKTDLEESGLICGGYQTIIFSLITLNEIKSIDKILENLNKRENGLLKLSYSLFEYDSSNSQLDDCFFNYENDTEYLYKENIGFTDTAYIIGGGHVGLAVSQIMKFIGFYVIVFDHRNDVFTMNQNTYADEKIITDYKNVNQFIKEGSKSYAIIVTPMHMGDKDALGSVIKLDLKYIGMMGSARKIKTVFNNLVKDGVDEKLFEKVHSPIGLEIEAETPQEIAVSIAAEIISIKRKAE
ncbi:MAG: XdhC family protein [Melioribacteraceae bacterium]|nr:XdhC family protein [Melioribacteraceae bacterium]